MTKGKVSYKNPYETGTPEWQLWENMRSNESTANAFTADAENYLIKATAAREKAEKFRVALEKLTGDTFDVVKAHDADRQLTAKKAEEP